MPHPAVALDKKTVCGYYSRKRVFCEVVLMHGAYILARYSTDRQNEDSIEVQVSACRKWCDERSLPVLDVFADEATSGMKDTRPQYARMMRQLDRGGADTVVIYDQSRMFRKMSAWFDFRDRLARQGVRVVSVTQPMIGGDLRDPANFVAEGSMALFNQMWVLQTRQKVVAKMRYMAEQGLHTGGTPPLGYKVVDGRLAIDTAEAETVRLIFGLYASGMTYREIIRRLNAEGRHTKRGGNFGVNSLHDLLKNPKYVGDLIYGKVAKRPDGSRNSHTAAEDAIVVKDVLPAIVDRETWEKVQLKMQENKRSAAGRPASAREYPLKGKVFCRECKSAMLVTASNRGAKRYYYYACAAKHRKGLCDNTPISAGTLETLVADAVRQRLGQPGNVEGLIRILREQRSKLSGSAVQRLRELQKRDKEISKQLDAAVAAVLAGLHSPTLTAKVNALEAERAKIAHDMQQLRAQVSGAEIDEPHLRELLALAMQDDAAVLSIVVRVEVGKDEIAVWTLLDADPNGDFDFAEDGVPITPSEVAPSYNNSGCPATGTSVRRSKHRSVSALRRKLHYVSSFFLLNCDPLCWARSLVFVFRCISIRNLSQNTESDQLMVLFFLYKSNLLRLALIWGLRSAASLSRIEAVLRLRLRQYANSRPDSGAGIILFFFLKAGFTGEGCRNIRRTSPCLNRRRRDRSTQRRRQELEYFALCSQSAQRDSRHAPDRRRHAFRPQAVCICGTRYCSWGRLSARGRKHSALQIPR